MTPLLRTITLWAAASAVLAGVFFLYARPGLMVMLSEQLWACFR